MTDQTSDSKTEPLITREGKQNYEHGLPKERKSLKRSFLKKIAMEDRGGFEEDGSMEDAMAEQEELESRVGAIFVGYLLSHCIAF